MSASEYDPNGVSPEALLIIDNVTRAMQEAFAKSKGLAPDDPALASMPLGDAAYWNQKFFETLWHFEMLVSMGDLVEQPRH
jgi:hypothetical protein